ncbi:uncharacterized protein RJT20DRAFT_16367 [Scheffersomyces xylosifermentans]|uniref:uncharacterized protein n=1 Tax=Scheffersomyces xylosifermentans TaxID=1304137 RepID=UPI00315C848F
MIVATTILFYFSIFAAAIPLSKRIYQPTSPIFSLIATHNGSQFQANLVKFDGVDLKLRADAPAFFGRIKGNEGYVLNIPEATDPKPSSVGVIVDENLRLTSNINSKEEASGYFGINESLLTFQNSSTFLACPSGGYRGEYDIYFFNGTNVCPEFGPGFNVTLLVQVSATVNYNPSTNKNDVFS